MGLMSRRWTSDSSATRPVHRSANAGSPHSSRTAAVRTDNTSNSTPSGTGIQEVATCENPLVDICFVHGVTGDRESTWTHANGTFWPRLLGAEIRDSRILTYGYVAGTAFLTTLTRIDAREAFRRDYALQLAADLNHARRANPQRPLILIAHSVGGLAVQETLLSCSTPSARGRYQSLVSSTVGVIFFGTPLEPNHQLWFKHLCRLYGLLNPSAQARQLHNLAPSPAISRIQGDFQACLQRSRDWTHIKTLSFHEGTTFGLTFEAIVQTEDEPARTRPNVSVILEDHLSMAKFSGAQDRNFEKVVDKICGWTGLTNTPVRKPEVIHRNPGEQNTTPQNPSPGHREGLSRQWYHIHEDPQGEFTRQEIQSASEWFRDLENKVHVHFPVLTYPLPKGKTPIKVAVIDTGIQLPNPYDLAYEGQVKFKSWIDGEPDTADAEGHGTHVAGLVLKVAPNATVYVERVVKNSEDLRPDLVAEGINHAVNVEGVDIISMSLGWEVRQQVVADAIDNALERGTIIFAAASNYGKRHDTAWPARAERVICVHSTDGYGNRCRWTPALLHKDFSVLGSAVSSYWPDHLGKGPEILKSGTSTSTPIAAGVAALCLEYMHDRIEKYYQSNGGTTLEHMWGLLHRSSGIEKMFERMLNEPQTDGYRCIMPWKLWNSRSEDQIVKEVLHHIGQL